MKHSTYNVARKEYFFREVLTARVATVYGLQAFADSIGSPLDSLLKVVASTPRFLREPKPFQYNPEIGRLSCKGWTHATQEEVEGERYLGGHVYIVYGKEQTEPPTEEQLNNPPERIEPKKLPPTKVRWAEVVTPEGCVFFVYNINAFCKVFDMHPASVYAVARDGRETFSPKGSRAVDETEVHAVLRVKYDPAIGHRRLMAAPLRKRTHIPRPKWRKADFTDVISAWKRDDLWVCLGGNPMLGIPSDDVLAQFGLTVDDIPGYKLLKGIPKNVAN